MPAQVSAVVKFGQSANVCTVASFASAMRPSPARDAARTQCATLNSGLDWTARRAAFTASSYRHRPEITVGADWTTVARIQNLHYALGWFTADVRGVHLVSHNGANPGFRAAIVLVPSSKAGVVILTNGESDLFTDAAMQGLLESLL